MAKWWPWRLRVSPTSSGSGATRSAEEVCTTPEGETEKISAAYPPASTYALDATVTPHATSAPNARFGASLAASDGFLAALVNATAAEIFSVSPLSAHRSRRSRLGSSTASLIVLRKVTASRPSTSL